jgi:hypothetical protein
MCGCPYFWPIAAVGVIAFLAELVFLFWAIRGWRAGHGVRSALWLVVPAVVVAMALPSLIVVLVSGGRPAFVEGAQWPRWETMIWVWNQEEVLSLGVSMGFPSILLGAITVGAAASRREGRVGRILFCSVAPATLGPFFGGIWLYLGSLPKDTIGPGRHPALSSTLAAAKHRLDMGVLAAGLALAAFFLWHAIQRVRTEKESVPLGANPRRTAVATTLILAVAAILWWLPGPLVAENLTPVPSYDPRNTERIFPAVPAGFSQNELYARSTEAWMKTYRGKLVYPLVARKQDSLVLSGVLVAISSDSVTVSGVTVKPWDLSDALVHAQSTDRLLHRNEVERPTMIMAPSDLPMGVVADALAVAYDVGDYEVRLVTGLPETIQRPAFGPLTRIILQSTTVSLACSKDINPKRQQRVLTLSKGGRRYRDLLDQVFELGDTSSPPVILLDREHSLQCNGRTP